MLYHKDFVERMRNQYPPGTRVEVISLCNEEEHLKPGMKGTVVGVDDQPALLVNWDNGKRTALNMEDDHFRIFQSDPMELKLYFPLHGELYTRNEWGDLADDPEELAGSELAPYLGDIREALQENQLPEEQERGLMHWYRESDALTWKVKSAFFDVELHDGQLWGMADCEILEPLEGDELNRLTTYLAGQAADGWGEGFEQQEIPVGRGLLYVHLWDGQDWEMSTTEPEQHESPGMEMAP